MKKTPIIIWERFSNVTNPIADGSVKERLNFYTTSVQSIIDNPILGIGIEIGKLNQLI